jgi:hypothetical protein
MAASLEEFAVKPDFDLAEDLVLPGDVVEDDGVLVEDEVADQAPHPPAALTERERRILAFERQWWRHAGAKEQAIRDTFDLSSTRYYQLLNGLLDNPAALEHDPVVVGRLRRLRSARARPRGAGRVA